jgi:hypothetical protein
MVIFIGERMHMKKPLEDYIHILDREGIKFSINKGNNNY